MSDRSKPHHTAEGFRNNYPSPPRGSFWKWQRERWRKGLPKMPEGGYHFELLKPDVAWLKANRTEPTLTWIGHATFLLQLGGLNILTDAHLTERASPFGFAGPRRVVPPALHFHDLPHIDAVVISHNHYDHLDRDTVQHVPSGGRLATLLRAARAQGLVRRPRHPRSDRARLVGKQRPRWPALHLVPVQHWSARTPWTTTGRCGAAGSWSCREPSQAACSGSSSPATPAIRATSTTSAGRFAPIDLAAIPIGAYEPRWFMQIMHVNPEEAVQIHQDLRARHSVAMHWGTFILTDEPLDEPPHRLAAARRAAGIPDRSSS